MPSLSSSAADYDICPYATFSLSNAPSGPGGPGGPGGALGSRSPAPDYTLQFQTFSQRDCYDAGPRPPRSLSRAGLGQGLGGLGHATLAAQEGFYASGGLKQRSGKRLVDSPPDGLSLGERTAGLTIL